MSDFLVWLFFAQRNHAQIVVITDVGRVGMVDISEITADFDSLGLVQPQNITAVAFALAALDRADDASFGNALACE